MANTAPFAEANIILHGPEGINDPDVMSVEARRLDGEVVTCWRLDAEEIAEINASGGLVWLSIMGHTMPPARVTGRKADVI